MSAGPGAGFSLVELMVSLTLGLAAMTAVGKVFQATSRSYAGNAQSSATQDNLRFGMAQIARDIEMAGFFADSEDPGRDIVIPPETRAAYPASGCSQEWLFDDLASLDTIGNVRSADAVAKFPCLQGVRDETDVLAIKRVLGRCERRPAANRFYLVETGTRAVLAFGNGGTAPGLSCDNSLGTGQISYFQYVPTIWHIASDYGIPSLCREILSGSRMIRNCVSQGIEDLQLEFGLDAAGDGSVQDGVADYFRSFDAPPDALQRSRIVAVRVHLLGRSVERSPDRAYILSEHRYLLGNIRRQPGPDGYYRKSMSALIPLRNPARRISPVALP